ncbi:PspA/IM30 family protein, partial [Oligoflexia bacterium]|nr:PspA/IM30 family protein [Oligoflexia bacterium]
MKTIRRFTSSILASFDWMVTQVENHEALVNSAIREVQAAQSRASVQLKRVQQDGKNMRRRAIEIKEADELWKERATKVAKLDEKRALECLRRRKRIQREVIELEEQSLEHARLEKQLVKDLSLVDERLGKLRQQKNLMRTRQSRAEALKSIQKDDSIIFSEIDEIFDRWEIKVSEYEIQGGCSTGSYDDFEDEFLSAEE